MRVSEEWVNESEQGGRRSRAQLHTVSHVMGRGMGGVYCISCARKSGEGLVNTTSS